MVTDPKKSLRKPRRAHLKVRRIEHRLLLQTLHHTGILDHTFLDINLSVSIILDIIVED